MKKLLFLLLLLAAVGTQAQNYTPFTKSYSYLQEFEGGFENVKEVKVFTKIIFNYNHASYVKIKVYGDDEHPSSYIYYLTSSWTEETLKSGTKVKTATVINTHDTNDTKYELTVFSNFAAVSIVNVTTREGTSFTNTKIKEDEPRDVY